MMTTIKCWEGWEEGGSGKHASIYKHFRRNVVKCHQTAAPPDPRELFVLKIEFGDNFLRIE